MSGNRPCGFAATRRSGHTFAPACDSMVSINDQTRVDLPPIQTCPCCSYALRGHGNSGRCPECGLRYEAEDCTVDCPVAPGIWSPRHVPIIAGGLLLYLLLPSPWPALSLVVILFAGLGITARIHTSLGLGRVAIRKEGIVAYRDHRRTSSILWPEVKSVELAGGPRRGWVMAVRRHRRLWLRVIPLGKDKCVAEQVVQCARRHVPT